MKSLTTTLALALLANSMAAQEPTKPDTEKRVADLERKLEILSKELESQKAGSAMPDAGEGKHGLAPAASKVYGVKGGLSIGGYGEVVYENFQATLENGTYSPRPNTVDFYRQILYAGYKFSDSIVFNMELEFEHAYAAGSQTVTKNGSGVVTDVKANRPGDVELEFAYLDFLFSPALNLRAGMVLIPMGFINEMHEPPTFLGAARPALERSLIPTTWRENGFGVHGELGQGWSYRAYLVAGLDGSKFTKAGLGGGRQQGAKSQAESWALTGRLDWSPVPGTSFGASFFSGNSQPGDNLPKLATRLIDLHAEVKWQGWQARLLVLRTHLDEAGLPASGALREVGTEQRGHYLEVGYNALSRSGSRQALIPYLRVERLERQAEVAAGVVKDASLSERITTFGAVYKPIPQVAVKADYNWIRNDARSGRNQFTLALGYYF
jgi:hypothetical protein